MLYRDDVTIDQLVENKLYSLRSPCGPERSKDRALWDSVFERVRNFTSDSGYMLLLMARLMCETFVVDETERRDLRGVLLDRHDVKKAKYREVVIERADRNTILPERRLAGNVYFLQDEYFGHIKIGKANTVKRIECLCLASPIPLRVVASLYSTRPYSVEHDLHVRFRYCRVHGEWFAPDVKLLELIKDINNGS